MARTAQAWLDDAKAAYESSTSFVDSNYRKKWEYGLRAFQNEHAPGSKYLSDDYKGRSRIFRPKTRSVIRKHEAAAALTIGNIDSIDFSPENPDDLGNLAAAEALKAVMRYRLSRTIPWFQIVVGAMQDAQTVGAVVSYNYWDYQTKMVNGEMRKVKDRPCIELKPIENIRIDPGAKWTDPIHSSPYLIDIIPMYVCDVEAMMATIDPKTESPKWKRFDRDTIKKATDLSPDSTRQIRQGKGGKDIYEDDRPIGAHSIVWVCKYFMREGADDYCFYTLGNNELLTEPKPVEEIYFHGMRPYTMGCTVLETHKAIPDAPTWLSRHIQLETNDVANQRLDNVKLVLNKRFVVGRGRQVDIQSLIRNVPGSVTLATNPKEDVVPMEWGDVTQSSYVEQDRLNADFDDLVGNFSPFTKFSGTGTDETLGRAKLAQTGASAMTEYAIQTLTETYFEPTLRQLMLLEQYYETDQSILATAARNARLFPKYGISQITDDLISKEVLVKVNIGAGATDPQSRLARFVSAIQAVIQIVQTAPPGANIEEITKEIFRNAGYRDGERFFGMQQDPRLIKAMEMIKGLQAEIAQGRYKIDTEAKLKQLEIMTNAKLKSDETNVNAARIDADSMLRQADTEVQAKSVDVQLLDVIMKNEAGGGDQQLKLIESNYRNQESEQRIMSEAQRRENEKLRTSVDVQKTAKEMELMDRESSASEDRDSKVEAATQTVMAAAQTIQMISAQMTTGADGIEKSDEHLAGLKEAVGLLAQAMGSLSSKVDGVANKPIPVSYKKRRLPTGNSAIEIRMSDGSVRAVGDDTE